MGDLKVLSGATLSVEAGEKIGLVGRNGAGKTTLLEILAGNSEADSGSVERIGGAKVGHDALRTCTRASGAAISVEQEITSAFEPLMRRERELEELEARLAEDHSHAAPGALRQAAERVRAGRRL